MRGVICAPFIYGQSTNKISMQLQEKLLFTQVFNSQNTTAVYSLVQLQ